jgi:hypothetical protein
MKLLYCGNCGDVMTLPVARWRTCECGAAGGGYADARQAYYAGPAGTSPLGIDAAAFREARDDAAADAANRQPRALGHTFDAFIVPWNAPTMRPCVVNGTFGEDDVPAAQDRARQAGARVELLRNAARCRACGETVVSWRDRHHHVTCSCGATSVDGGAAYRKLVGRAISEALFVVAHPAPAEATGAGRRRS